jgi:hypothetical protein
MMIKKIELECSKYTVVYNSDTGELNTLRYGEVWRDHIGDKLIMALVHRILDLEEIVEVEATDKEDRKFCERCSVELLRDVEDDLCPRCAAMKTAKEIIDGKEVTLFSLPCLQALREALERKPLWVRNTPDEQRAVLYEKMGMGEDAPFSF